MNELKETENEINIEFEDIAVSTRTIIGITNWTLDIEELYEVLPITEYNVQPKKRGRKRKEEKEIPNKILEDGSIVTVKYKKKIKGCELKTKKKSKTGYFRNSLTVVMAMDKRMINFKVSKNGKIQLTGCKYDHYAENCMKYLWNIINLSANKDKIVELPEGENPSVIFLTVMTNIDFDLGFNINRENLDKYINNNTDFNSLLETSFGYTGVNIKIPFKRPSDMILKKIVWKKEGNKPEDWVEDQLTYGDYFSTLPEKDRKKENNKSHYNTFLVFYSGRVIMSSMNINYMKDTYTKFIDIIRESRGEIEEKAER